MSQKAAPRRTGVMRKQIGQWLFSRDIKQPSTKRRKGRGTKIGKQAVVTHVPPAW